MVNDYNHNKHKLYLTYVDHILAAFDKGQDSLNFSNFKFNIKFTIPN